MKQPARYLISSVILALILSVISNVNRENEDFRPFFLDRDSLVAAIDIEHSIFSSKGFPIGFQYQLLSEYAVKQKCKINITTAYFESDYWAMMLDGEVDVIVVENTDTIPELYCGLLRKSIPMNDFYWVVRESEMKLLDNINIWLSYYMQTSEYKNLQKRFFRSYRIDSYIDNMVTTNYLSPYDEIIKRHSRSLGWDWRLLAALIYQESRFSMGAKSRKGASGLMQVIPSTAKHFGIDDIYNPDENVRAGVTYLRHLKKIYSSKGLDSANVVKFCLAAYNAGEGRIEDCINFTASQGRDSLDWEEVSRAIPLMTMPEHSVNLKYGKFNGEETIKYVDDILTKYEEYLFVVKP